MGNGICFGKHYAPSSPCTVFQHAQKASQMMLFAKTVARLADEQCRSCNTTSSARTKFEPHAVQSTEAVRSGEGCEWRLWRVESWLHSARDPCVPSLALGHGLEPDPAALEADWSPIAKIWESLDLDHAADFMRKYVPARERPANEKTNPMCCDLSSG
jgi:hypothetical protein